MKKISFFLLFFLSINCYSNTLNNPPREISPDIAMKAIQHFKQDPTSKEAMEYLSIILDFAEKSQTITVKINEKYLPYELGTINKQYDPLFIGAYIAGNVESQLTTNSTKDAAFEGIKLVLYTYVKLRSKSIIKQHKEFEKWIDLYKKNELRKWLKI